MKFSLKLSPKLFLVLIAALALSVCIPRVFADDSSGGSETAGTASGGGGDGAASSQNSASGNSATASSGQGGGGDGAAANANSTAAPTAKAGDPATETPEDVKSNVQSAALVFGGFCPTGTCYRFSLGGNGAASASCGGANTKGAGPGEESCNNWLGGSGGHAPVDPNQPVSI